MKANLPSLQSPPEPGFTAFLQRTARYWPFWLVLSGRDSSALGCSFALSDTSRTVLGTLSRWRHGFESRWGCKHNPWSEQVSRLRSSFLKTDCQSVANPGRKIGMRGFIRRRGDAWELRVFLGVDAVTGRKRYVNKTVRDGRREADRELLDRRSRPSTAGSVGPSRDRCRRSR